MILILNVFIITCSWNESESEEFVSVLNRWLKRSGRREKVTQKLEVWSVQRSTNSTSVMSQIWLNPLSCQRLALGVHTLFPTFVFLLCQLSFPWASACYCVCGGIRCRVYVQYVQRVILSWKGTRGGEALIFTGTNHPIPPAVYRQSCQPKSNAKPMLIALMLLPCQPWLGSGLQHRATK